MTAGLESPRRRQLLAAAWRSAVPLSCIEWLPAV
jgi:hypothetical protein